jgi:hypothetical protein
MKKIFFIISVFVLGFVSVKSVAQTDKETSGKGNIQSETKSVSVQPLENKTTSLKRAPDVIETKTVENNSAYNDDGTLKIPGYTPTGNPEVDEKNYSKAKYELYQNNKEEYDKIFGKKPISIPIRVTAEEFNKMPKNKQEQILSRPDKFYVEKPENNQDKQ